ncbi:MAG: type I-C CRISPR-associated protein Cas8c/Csd1 [Oscillospiraceae bacterium]|nr:type I-C CRISPR-associated protein Cas8c/Csd1 [Oscillospiraceae bacterium]
MSWTNELYKLYDDYCGFDENGNVMLPLFHSTQNAQVEITIDESGNFVTAARITEKNQGETIIPVTDDSVARSSGIAPHPFADKMVYIAGDYGSYFKGKNSDNSAFFTAYTEGLKKWKESPYSHKAVDALYAYISKKSVMADLVKTGVFVLAEDTGELDGSKMHGIAQQDFFARFRVNYKDLSLESRTWKDKSLYDSFAAYNSSRFGDLQICYATGKELPCTYKHPAKLRNGGDKAKLISSNDESGFSYRGRFSSKEEAISVSQDFSQKMHNALKWIIKRQGVSIDSLTLVAWETGLNEIPSVIKSSYDFFDFDDSETEPPSTFPAYREQLRGALFGNKSLLDPGSKTIIMAFDSATTGRLSMVMYTELATSDFLENINKWHNNTAWYRFKGKLGKSVVESFSLYEIADFALGTEQGDSVKCKEDVLRDNMCRLIPCVTEGRPVPRDLVNALVNKASNPLAYKNRYNFSKVVEAACGMIRKSAIENGEECDMALNSDNCERSYLYGRLLAAAEYLEYNTYSEEEKGESKDKKGRITNAKRYWKRFSERPYETWKILEERLVDYYNKSEYPCKVRYSKTVEEIMNNFDIKDYENNRKLSPSYLLGYHCQLSALYSKSDKNNKEEN